MEHTSASGKTVACGGKRGEGGIGVSVLFSVKHLFFCGVNKNPTPCGIPDEGNGKGIEVGLSPKSIGEDRDRQAPCLGRIPFKSANWFEELIRSPFRPGL